MNRTTWIIVAIIAFLGLMVMGTSNTLSYKEEQVFKTWGNLDSALQRRADLIPNLVATVQGYASHEKNTLQAVIDARASVGRATLDVSQLNDEKFMAEYMGKHNQLQGALQKLMVVTEAYPNLKANDNFMALQHQIEGTENRINYARTQVNEVVGDFNSSLRRFPSSLINSMFLHLDKKAFFQASEESRTVPKVAFKE